MKNRLHKQVFAILFGLLLSSQALAVSYDLGVKYGFYSFSSQTSTETASISFPGYFGFEFDISVTDNLVIAPGYSMYIISTESIDLGYGFDLIAKYFPFTSASVTRETNKNDEWTSAPLWRPYVMAGFEQRQFQSIQSNYAGILVGLGTHYQMFQEDYLFGECNFSYLSGPSTSNIKELKLAIGYGFSAL